MQAREGVWDGVRALPANEDADLVAAAVRGGRDALAGLYDRHAPLLQALGVRILGDRGEAEDVLHDVFLEAWHHAHEYDVARGTVRAWLVTRMRSRALDRRHRTQRGNKVATDAAAEATHVADASDMMVDSDRQRVRRVVGDLSDDLNRVIDLAYFEGLSCSEIAGCLEVPIGTVKSRLARAVAVLKDRIGPRNGDTP